MGKADISLYGCPGTVTIDGVTNQENWEAGENLVDGDAVCLKPNDLFFDSMETYADNAAFQAVYVDSDGSNKMVTKESTNFAIGTRAMKITSAGAANSGDLAIRTISARNLTGYSLCMLVRGSTGTTNFSVRIGATAGLATNYLEKDVVVATPDIYELLVLPISAFSSSGSPVLTAITQVGFYHTGSGTESIIVDRIWFYKAATTKNQLYKADATNWSKLPAIGFVDAAVSQNAIVGNVINHNLLDGFTGLVPGEDVYLSETSGAIVQAKTSLPTLKQKLGTAVSATTIFVNIGTPA